MKIKNGKKGSFDFWTDTGRRVNGTYYRQPDEEEPSTLVLVTVTERDPTGQAHSIIQEYDVTGWLETSTLRDLGKALDQRAEAAERGERPPAHVEIVDITKTPVWTQFLKNNPAFLKKHPHYLKDAVRNDDSTN